MEYQVVIPESLDDDFRKWVVDRGWRLFPIPSGDDDLKTYGIGPVDPPAAEVHQTLAERFPDIKWTEPQYVEIIGGGSGFICRICVSMLGWSAKDGAPFETKEEAQGHIEDEHPEYQP